MTGSEAREEAVRAAVAKRRERVNAAITEELPLKEPRKLWEASRYLLDAGGKRLRPSMLLLVAEALSDVPAEAADYRSFPTLSGERIDVMKAAVAVEVIQTFTLIHDDIMDDDDLRRGVAAVHREYDTETAILAGDTLFSTAFEVLVDTAAPHGRSVRALDILASTCTEICEGQAMDLSFETQSDTTPEEYLEMVKQKTAVLYAASAAIPAVLVGAETDTVDALYEYGLDVGRAFQIQDDILDLTVPSEQLGKQRGSDLVEHKQTLITVYAREQGVDIESLVETDDVDAVTDAEIEAAVEELRAVGSIEYASDTARDLVERGKDRLDRLPDNDASEMLAEIADYLVERGY